MPTRRAVTFLGRVQPMQQPFIRLLCLAVSTLSVVVIGASTVGRAQPKSFDGAYKGSLECEQGGLKSFAGHSLSSFVTAGSPGVHRRSTLTEGKNSLSAWGPEPSIQTAYFASVIPCTHATTAFVSTIAERSTQRVVH